MNIERQYLNLLNDILENGITKSDRTGTGTISVFGRQIRHKMSDGFPLLTTKKIHFKGVITELLWFLRGDTNIKYLIDNDCHIWDGDAYKAYEKKVPLECVIGSDSDTIQYNMVWDKKIDHLSGYPIFERLSKEEFINKIKTDDEFAKKWGELGPIYGKQWREWYYLTIEQKQDIDGIDEEICGVDMWDGIRYYRTFDQIANLIKDLKTNPDSRRLMVNAWNVGELDNMVLPPCHYGFQVYTREMSVQERKKYDIHFDDLIGEYPEHHITLDKRGVPRRAISLMWNQRSCDTPLGIPYNITSYSLLLEIIGKMVNMVPEELIGNLGDCHIYLNQVEGVKEQLSREPYNFPKLIHNKSDEFYSSLSNDLNLLEQIEPSDFKLEDYKSHPKIYFPLSN